MYGNQNSIESIAITCNLYESVYISVNQYKNLLSCCCIF